MAPFCFYTIIWTLPAKTAKDPGCHRRKASGDNLDEHCKEPDLKKSGAHKYAPGIDYFFPCFHNAAPSLIVFVSDFVELLRTT